MGALVLSVSLSVLLNQPTVWFSVDSLFFGLSRWCPLDDGPYGPEYALAVSEI